KLTEQNRRLVNSGICLSYRSSIIAANKNILYWLQECSSVLQVNIEEFTYKYEKVFGPLTEAQARALRDLTEPKANPQGAKASNNKSSQPRRRVTLKEFRLAVDGRLSSLLTNRDQNSNFIQKTGKVVHILTEVHSRAAIGSIKPMRDSDRMALLIPVDRRLPAIKFQINQGPSGTQTSRC
uniref:Uncharacterized protein n=1 Tax=Biomphalaria glabrata TaxID=6526 RepID=A0A2C9LAZ3_BIOGL